MSSDTLDENYNEIPKAKRKRSAKAIQLSEDINSETIVRETDYCSTLMLHGLHPEACAFASHLTGHSEITIKAMYQEWVVNKNAPFKPL